MQRIKFISLVISVFYVCSCNNNKQNKNVKPTSDNMFASINYDKVVAYNYNGEDGNEIIDDSGHLSDKIKKQIILNNFQIIGITNTLCHKSTYGGDVAACFNPHLGIVFYNKNKDVAHISICLDCNIIVSSINIPNLKGGFSDDGIKEILDFEKEINY